MRDDAVNTTPIKRNRSVELAQQVRHLLGQITCTYTAAFFALRKDVVATHVGMYQVHQQRNTCAVIRTQYVTLSPPVCLGLGDFVLTLGTMHCVNVCYEQRLV